MCPGGKSLACGRPADHWAAVQALKFISNRFSRLGKTPGSPRKHKNNRDLAIFDDYSPGLFPGPPAGPLGMEIAAGDRAGAGEFHPARPWVDSANLPVAPESFFPVLAVRIDESPQRVDNRSGGKQGLDTRDWAVAPEWVDSSPRGWSGSSSAVVMANVRATFRTLPTVELTAPHRFPRQKNLHEPVAATRPRDLGCDPSRSRSPAGRP